MGDPATTCPQCGAAIDATHGGGVCVACMLGDAMVPAEPSSALGCIGGHELIEVIARGGMGIVYRARQNDPVREVALKALPGAELLSGEARQRFKIEAQAMARLEHPNILPVHEIGEEDGTPFFTMKLATGGTLAQRSGDYAGKWRAIAELIATLAEAVQFAHSRGVLHRDLKPGNILFDEHGAGFVSDFGLAKLIDTDADLTRTLATMGTPAYLAPELVNGSKHGASAASDVWSLGVMLYELLAGRPPFRAENAAALLRQIAEDEPPALSGEIPRDLAVITLKTLQKDSGRRYATAQELADDLRRWLSNRPIAARPVSVVERIALTIRRRPAVAALSALLLGVLSVSSVLVRKENQKLSATLKERDLVLRTALMSEARLLRKSGEPGQRLDALDTLRRSAALGAGADIAEETAASLAKVDLRLQRSVAMGIDDTPGCRVALSPDFSLCAWKKQESSGSTIWCLSDTKTGAVVNTYRTNGIASGFLFSPDGKRVVAATPTHPTVLIWSVENATAPVEVVKTDSERRGAFVFLPTGGWMLATDDGFLMRKSADAAVEKVTVNPQTGGTAQRLAVDPVTRQIAAIQSGGVHCWSIDDGHETKWHPLPDGMTRLDDMLFWHPFGGALVTGDRKGQLITLQVGESAVPAAVRFFGVNDAKPNPQRTVFGPTKFISYLESKPTSLGRVSPAQGDVLSAAADPLGRFVATLSNDGKLRLTDALNRLPLLTRGGHTSGFSQGCVQFSPDGRQLASFLLGGQLAVFDVITSDVWKELPRRPWNAFGVMGQDSTYMRRLMASADGDFLCSWTPAGARVWNLKGKESVRSTFIPIGGDEAQPVCFDRLTGDLIGKERESEIDTPEKFHARVPPQLVRVPRKLLADGASPMLLPSQLVRTPFDGYVTQIIEHENSWLVHDDGKSLRMNKRDERSYQLVNERVRPVTWQVWPQGDATRAIHLRSTSREYILMPRASEDGRYFVILDYNSKKKGEEALVYAVDRPASPVAVVPVDGVRDVLFSPDGNWLFVCTRTGYTLFSIRGDQLISATTFPNKRARPTFAASFSRDSKTLAFEEMDDTIFLLNLQDIRQHIRLAAPHPVGVTCMTFNHDGSRLFLGCTGERVYEWNIARLREELSEMGVGWWKQGE